jgi:cytochrome c oxidase subunit II
MTRLGHGGRILAIWLGSSAVILTLLAIFLTPHLPPGTASVEAAGQQRDNEVLTLVSVWICLGIFAYFGYVLIAFRARGADPTLDGPPIRGHARLQALWLVFTTVLVLCLAGFGTYELLGGAGGGQGSNPIFVPSASAATGGKPLQVQVIAQQWQFTFRYPSEGGFESARFMLPVNRQVELHVTSLDVIHSFWVPALGVKADANPGADNIAYVTPTRIEKLAIHCAELCGLFHGYMFDNTARVVSQSAFAAWANGMRQFVSPVTHYLPKYSHTYLPDPAFRAG